MSDSTIPAATTQALAPGALRPRASRGTRARRLARSKPLGVVGITLVLVVGLLSLFADVVTSYSPTQLAGVPLQGPSRDHWFGTDDFGRDVFSRVVHGGRVSVTVGFFSVAAGLLSGTVIGVLSAYRGGWFDLIIQRIVDAMMAFPTLVLALAVVAALGTSQRNVVIAIGVSIFPNVARVARSVVLSIREEPYVEAARASGASDMGIMSRHIFPNIVPPLIVIATAFFGSAVVAEAALSFVGLGIPPPNPSWGNMMSGAARTYITVAPWMAIFPGVALSLLVFGINLFGDSLRDVLDPQLRNR